MSHNGTSTAQGEADPNTDPTSTMPPEEVDDNIGNRIGPPPSRPATIDDDEQPTVDGGAEAAAGEGADVDEGPEVAGAEPDPGNAIHDPNKKKRRRKKGRGAGASAEGAGNQGAAPSGNNNYPTHNNGPAHRAFKIGDKVRARVIEVGNGGVLCDLWGKEKGVLDLRELQVDNPEPKAGDAVEVIVLQDGARGGYLVVTRDLARAERGREMAAQAYNANEPVEGLVTGLNKGGLEVDVSGVRAFCPSSQVDVRLPSLPELQAMVLSRELFRVTSMIEGGRELVVSRRALREGEVRERAEQAAANLKVGDRVKGVVVSVRDHGIYVDLGGIEGRIQLQEISHDRGARPHDVARVGDEIEALVLRIDIPAPAPAPKPGEPEAAAEAPATDGVETAATESATDSLDESRDRGGDRDRAKKSRFSRRPEGTPRVELSRRAIEVDPWSDVHKRFPIGTVHKGKVARMQPFGAFVELEKGLDGLLHVSEIGDRRIEHPNEVLKDGQDVTVRVTKIDRQAKRIGLALLPEGVTEDQLKQSVQPRPGMITTAKIVEHESFGVFAQLDNTVGKVGRGLIMPQDSNVPRGGDLKKALPVGMEVKVKIVEIERGRLKLSIKAAIHDEERQAYRAYQQQANSTTVGVSLADKLRKLNLVR
ncbi:MAG: rpsA3 [Myxococcaceae bacterium]|nr:rpsA3 [Myxococcaceae bacterium]